jgi:hypothetical protein
MPATIRFLGYNPLPPARMWAEKLVSGRKTLGSLLIRNRRGGLSWTRALWPGGNEESASRVASLRRE